MLVLPYNPSVLLTELGPTIEAGGETDTVQIDATEPVRSEIKLVPEQGTLKKGAFKQGKKGIESARVSDVIFADIIGSANDNDDMQIKIAEGNFTPSNKKHKVEFLDKENKEETLGILHTF